LGWLPPVAVDNPGAPSAYLGSDGLELDAREAFQYAHAFSLGAQFLSRVNSVVAPLNLLPPSVCTRSEMVASVVLELRPQNEFVPSLKTHSECELDAHSVLLQGTQL
jgi:hypothetical protein